MARKTKKYNRFFHTFFWSLPRASKAEKDGYLIESLILTAAHIDALLRCLIYCNKQLRYKTTKIKDDALFIQKPRDKKYPYRSEITIIKKAYNEKVINKKIKKALITFSKSRNVFVHRLFLGNWKYSDIKKLLKRGRPLVLKLQKKQIKLIGKQVHLGLLKGPAFIEVKDVPPKDKEEIARFIKEHYQQ